MVVMAGVIIVMTVFDDVHGGWALERQLTFDNGSGGWRQWAWSFDGDDGGWQWSAWWTMKTEL